jgi:flagellar biosynthesis protein FlhF
LKIKRFFAKDMKTALLQVKDELGVDAVIMSNKKVAGGVEIVAAIDGENSAVKTPTQLYSSQPRHQSAQASASQATLKSRQLEDDRVNINVGLPRPTAAARSAAAQNALSASPSISKRFANLLKHYGDDSEREHTAENEDSLMALLARQDDSPTLAPMSRPAANNPLQRSKLDPTRFERGRRDDSELPKAEMEAMKEDINSIRKLLEHQVSGLMWQEVERREPLRAMLIKRLERMGVSLDMADQLACYIPEDIEPQKAWIALLKLICDQIPLAKQDILKKGGVVALLGPTGVGKTTTVAKLAARAAMEYGSDNVALVTTDTYRIGAHEQLAIYGRIIGCPVKVAKDSNELADIIHQLRNRRLILVDTAGMGQRDVRLSEQLDTLMQNSGEVIQSYLVLPATAQRKVLQETIEHFRRIPLSGCIMTKLDESLSLGEFVSVVVQNALPVAYIANGQRVPEDIVIAQPKYMVAKANELLEKSLDDQPHYWASDSERA